MSQQNRKQLPEEILAHELLKRAKRADRIYMFKSFLRKSTLSSTLMLIIFWLSQNGFFFRFEYGFDGQNLFSYSSDDTPIHKKSDTENMPTKKKVNSNQKLISSSVSVAMD